MEIKPKFLVQDKVKAVDGKFNGVVTSIAVNNRDGGQLRYSVSYIDTNGKPDRAYFEGWELAVNNSV